MKIIASPANYNELIALLDNGIDIILLGDNNYCVRNVYDCKLDVLKEICKLNNHNSKIWVNVNSFFYENQINDLQNYLLELSKLNIDRVIFNDLAVAQINDEMQLNLKLHYDPVTLITSYGQFEFYKENNFQSVSISNELFLPEVKTILKNKLDDLKICMQVHGFVLIMHSRWNLVTNFQTYINDEHDEYSRNKIITIRENQRQYSNHIFEDKHGTHMFSGYELCLIKYLKELYDNGLDYIKIDNILQPVDKNYSLNISLIYKQAINLIKNNNFDENEINKLYEKIKMYAFDENKIASGFIGGIKEIKHYENI